MGDSGLTVYLRIGSTFKLEEHDFEGIDCIIVMLCLVKRCIV
jgi:hypothetical protein